MTPPRNAAYPNTDCNTSTGVPMQVTYHAERSGPAPSYGTWWQRRSVSASVRSGRWCGHDTPRPAPEDSRFNRSRHRRANVPQVRDWTARHPAKTRARGDASCAIAVQYEVVMLNSRLLLSWLSERRSAAGADPTHSRRMLVRALAE